MEVKGSAIVAIRDFVLNNFPEEHEQWLQSLSNESKEIYLDIIDSSEWYPIEAGAVQPTLQVSNMFYNGDFKKGAWEAGRYSAKKGLTGVYRLYVKASTPSHIITRASRVFSGYYRPFKLMLVEKGDHTVTLEISQMDKCHDVIKYRIGGWMQKALEISGCKDVEINFEENEIENQKIFKIVINWK